MESRGLFVACNVGKYKARQGKFYKMEVEEVGRILRLERNRSQRIEATGVERLRTEAAGIDREGIAAKGSETTSLSSNGIETSRNELPGIDT